MSPKAVYGGESAQQLIPARSEHGVKGRSPLARGLGDEIPQRSLLDRFPIIANQRFAVVAEGGLRRRKRRPSACARPRYLFRFVGYPGESTFFRAVNPEHLSDFGSFSWGKCAVFCANRRLKGRKPKYCRIFSLSPIVFYVIMTVGCADFCTLSMFVRRPCGRNQHIHFRRVINLCL